MDRLQISSFFVVLTVSTCPHFLAMGVGSSISKSKVLSESESEKSEIDTDRHELEKEKSDHVIEEKVVVNELEVKDTDKLRNKVNFFFLMRFSMYCLTLIYI